MKDGDSLHDFLHTMHCFRRLHWNFLLQGLSHREYMFLEIIQQFHKKNPDVPGIYVSELAAQLCITKSAVSKMLQHLEQRGLIVRNVDVRDRRNTFVSLTEAGQELCTCQRRRCSQFMQHVANDLGEEHFRMILAGMREFAQAMEHELTEQKRTE